MEDGFSKEDFKISSFYIFISIRRENLYFFWNGPKIMTDKLFFCFEISFRFNSGKTFFFQRLQKIFLHRSKLLQFIFRESKLANSSLPFSLIYSLSLQNTLRFTLIEELWWYIATSVSSLRFICWDLILWYICTNTMIQLFLGPKLSLQIFAKKWTAFRQLLLRCKWLMICQYLVFIGCET